MVQTRALLLAIKATQFKDMNVRALLLAIKAIQCKGKNTS